MSNKSSRLNKLPSVEHIEGISLVRQEHPRKTYVTLEYKDKGQKNHEIEIPLLDAFNLLSMLEAMYNDVNYDTMGQPLGILH